MPTECPVCIAAAEEANRAVYGGTGAYRDASAERAAVELANGRVLGGRIPWEIKRRLYKAKIRMT